MTTKYDPPSVDDTGPSLTSDEIYDSEVGKKFTEALEEQRIEKCFEEIKQVLKKYECMIHIAGGFGLEIWKNDLSKHECYSPKDFDK